MDIAPPNKLGTSWIARHALPFGMAAGLFFCSVVGAFVLFVFSLLRNNGAVELAVRTASDSDVVAKAVGKPFRVGRFVTGNINTDAGSGNADLNIRISGPRGKGTLLEWAQENRGKWEICSLLYRPADGSADITIISDENTRCERE